MSTSAAKGAKKEAKKRALGEKKSTKLNESSTGTNSGDNVAGSLDEEDSRYKSLMKDENKRIAEEKKKADAEKKRLKQAPGRVIPQILSKDESDAVTRIKHTHLDGLLSKNNRYKPDPGFDISVYLGGDDGLKRPSVPARGAATPKIRPTKSSSSTPQTKPVAITIDFDF